MRQTALLLAASLLAIALSGCAGDDVPGADPEDLSGLEGDPATPPINRAPVANLTADLTNGTAPLNVTFTLSGSDADGDNLTWSFDAGDGNTTANGTSLPATVNVTYAAVGNHSATLTVSDGTNETVQTFLVSVAEAAPAVVEDTRTILEGEVSATCSNCYIVGSNACVDWNLQTPGGDCTWFDLDPALVGQPFVTESPGDADLEFRTSCSLTSQSVEIHGVEGQESGTVPDAGCVVLFEYSDPGLLRFIVG